MELSLSYNLTNTHRQAYKKPIPCSHNILLHVDSCSFLKETGPIQAEALNTDTYMFMLTKLPFFTARDKLQFSQQSLLASLKFTQTSTFFIWIENGDIVEEKLTTKSKFSNSDHILRRRQIHDRLSRITHNGGAEEQH
ncbi:unnamed protein product [Urochloa humidicola]